MSTALVKAGSLKPEIRLAQVLSQFEATLSTEQKQKLHASKAEAAKTPPGISDVMRLIGEIDRQRSGSLGNKRCIGPRFSNFLQAVQQFAAIGDVVIGGSQNLIACGVWSVVRMSLLLSELLMSVGRAAPRNNTLAIVYPQSKTLQGYLCEYHIHVVKLCIFVYGLSEKSKIGLFASTLGDADLKGFQSDLDRWAVTIKAELDILLAVALQEERKDAAGFRKFWQKSNGRQQQLDLQRRILDACTTYDPEPAWKQLRKAGTTSFISESEVFTQWKNSANQSETIVVQGKLGAGKSVAAANVVSSLYADGNASRYAVTYFFCRHGDAASLKPTTVVGSFLRQLLQQVPSWETQLPQTYDLRPNSTLDGLISSLSEVWPSAQRACFTRMFFILDGLDECSISDARSIVGRLKDMQEKLAVHLYISTRPGSILDGITSQLGPFTKLAMLTDVNPDISRYIDDQLEECLRSEALVLRDYTLISAIRNTLVSKSGGMFLWVVLQIQTLCTMRTDFAIREALSGLPDDLPQTYIRILGQAKESSKVMQRRVLETLVTVQRPITTDELCEALSVQPGDIQWDPNKILNEITSTLACCGSLIIVEEEDSTVNLVHSSVAQFLADGACGLYQPDFTQQQAEQHMADIVLTYLNYEIFETQLTKARPQQVIDDSTSKKIIAASLDRSVVRNLAIRFLQSSKTGVSVDVNRLVSDVCESRSRVVACGFPFRQYIEKHGWAHLQHFEPSENTAGLFCRAWQERRLPDERQIDLRKQIAHVHLDILQAVRKRYRQQQGIHVENESSPLVAAMSLTDKDIGYSSQTIDRFSQGPDRIHYEEVLGRFHPMLSCCSQEELEHLFLYTARNRLSRICIILYEFVFQTEANVSGYEKALDIACKMNYDDIIQILTDPIGRIPCPATQTTMKLVEALREKRLHSACTILGLPRTYVATWQPQDVYRMLLPAVWQDDVLRFELLIYLLKPPKQTFETLLMPIITSLYHRDFRRAGTLWCLATDKGTYVPEAWSPFSRLENDTTESWTSRLPSLFETNFDPDYHFAPLAISYDLANVVVGAWPEQAAYPGPLDAYCDGRVTWSLNFRGFSSPAFAHDRTSSSSGLPSSITLGYLQLQSTKSDNAYRIEELVYLAVAYGKDVYTHGWLPKNFTSRDLRMEVVNLRRSEYVTAMTYAPQSSGTDGGISYFKIKTSQDARYQFGRTRMSKRQFTQAMRVTGTRERPCFRGFYALEVKDLQSSTFSGHPFPCLGTVWGAAPADL